MTEALRESLGDYFMGRRKATDESVMQTRDTVWISTGCDVLDCAVGGGAGYGYPAGRIINIVGDRSSGKSLLASELIASAHHFYGDKCKWVYDDCETGFTFDTKPIYGIDIIPSDPEKQIISKTVEDSYCNIRIFMEELRGEEFGIYVEDSLDGLSSEETEKLANDRVKKFKKRQGVVDDTRDSTKDKDKGSYRMGVPKYLSQEFFKTLHGRLKDKNILLVFTNQLRSNIDPLSMKKWTRAGGKALDFYAYSTLWLTHLKKIESHGVEIGGVVRARIDKLKAPRKFEVVFSYFTDYGIDNIGTSLDYLYDLRGERGELLTAANKIKFLEDTEEKKRSEWITLIDNDPALQKELRTRVRAKWNTIQEKIKTVRNPKYGNA